jgi:hypothetical protein
MYVLNNKEGIPEGTSLAEKLKQANAPPYVTPEIAIRILNLMLSNKIHPRHRGCDTTIEGLAGVPIITSWNYHLERKDNEPSIYASLYQTVFGQPQK